MSAFWRRVLRIAAALAMFAPPALAFSVHNLSNPQSFIVDEATGKYYISNVQGRPMVKDNRAFITLLSPDGAVDRLKFIEGGRDGVTLHAPKGMAIMGNTLYVVDIDHVRGFDKITGSPVADIDLTVHKVKYLNDVAVGFDGKLFVSDTVGNTVFAIRFPKEAPKEHSKEPVKAAAKESAKEPLKDLVKEPVVEVFAAGKALDSPNGLVYSKKHGKLFVTLGRGMVGAFGAEGKLETVATFPARGLVGIDMDTDGALYISSFTRGNIFRLVPGGKPVLVEHSLMTPAGISLDRKKKLILVPLFLKHQAHTIEY